MDWIISANSSVEMFCNFIYHHSNFRTAAMQCWWHPNISVHFFTDLKAFKCSNSDLLDSELELFSMFALFFNI